jgi:hypothetical protein
VHKVRAADPPHGERKPDVPILFGAVNLTSPVGTGDPVLQITGHLEHSQPGAENVYGEPDLHAPTRR